jgi:SulP family sulfate permease
VETIATRFGGIPQGLPRFALPWNLPGPAEAPFVLNWDTLRALLPSAVAIALLGAIESLLSAVVADAMAQTRHDPDAELVALGVGNLLCPFFGGIAATGAIARTGTNIRSGAQSPLAAVFHALFVLLAVLFLAPAVGYLPMAALAALLIRVAYNISEMKHFAHILRVAPRSDVAVLLTCFGLTVLFDMVVGVTVGVVLAALLLMRRLAALTSARLVSADEHPLLVESLPKGVLLYEIAGPLFFGAAQRAADQISHALHSDGVQTIIFDMTNIPAMDMTGLVALENTLKTLTDARTRVILCGVQPQPRALLQKAGILHPDQVSIELCARIEEAVVRAKAITPDSLRHAGSK